MPPAFLTVMVASLRCLPLAQNLKSIGDALSTVFVIDRSLNVTLPPPSPPVADADAPEFVTPKLHEFISIIHGLPFVPFIPSIVIKYPR